MSSVIREVLSTHTYAQKGREIKGERQDTPGNTRESYKFIICLFTYKDLVPVLVVYRVALPQCPPACPTSQPMPSVLNFPERKRNYFFILFFFFLFVGHVGSITSARSAHAHTCTHSHTQTYTHFLATHIEGEHI